LIQSTLIQSTLIHSFKTPQLLAVVPLMVPDATSAAGLTAAGARAARAGKR
jgi:hypothetical protein